MDLPPPTSRPPGSDSDSGRCPPRDPRTAGYVLHGAHRSDVTERRRTPPVSRGLPPVRPSRRETVAPLGTGTVSSDTGVVARDGVRLVGVEVQTPPGTLRSHSTHDGTLPVHSTYRVRTHTPSPGARSDLLTDPAPTRCCMRLRATRVPPYRRRRPCTGGCGSRRHSLRRSCRSSSTGLTSLRGCWTWTTGCRSYRSPTRRIPCRTNPSIRGGVREEWTGRTGGRRVRGTPRVYGRSPPVPDSGYY